MMATPKSNPPEEDEVGEFAGLPPEMVVAFVYRSGGPGMIRSMFEMALESQPITREFIEGLAAALELRGLNPPATLLREIAAESPSEDELCPYGEDEGDNRTQWLRSRRIRRMINSGEIEKRLRRKARRNRG
jgi:hypothetical protein